ncbi:hypothetical protein G5714_016115 [Onychostoma macrolepis]|uniref:C2H2-type domain-containing protein n=1 Tax=Onychostoma macrolepis TaxID=369639 RepID=A0A7J6CBT7_9TELE|nr:hypothetical protein G5714_016115 [Onychostoma macrolepis]
MDKDRLAAGPCSWLDMHNFIGDLMAANASVTGHPLREQHTETPSSAWLRVSHPPQSTPSRQSQVKSAVRFGLQERERDPRDHESHAQHHACTCPGCPLSSSPSSSSIHTLKPRTSPASQIQPPSSPQSTPPQQTKEPSAGPVGLGLCLGLGLSLEEENTEPSSTSAHPQQEDKGTSTHSPVPQANPESPPVQAFPCLCHRGFQTCSQLLRQQKDSEAHIAHHHYHHHHHHCPLTTCTSCTLPSFPCLSCQRTFPTCAQLLRHQQGHAQQEGLQQLPCMHCNASFPRPSQLLQHQRTQHASKAGGFLCAECGRAFNSHSNLRIHLNSIQASSLNQIHLQEMEERSPPSKEQLRGDGDKEALPYACEDCGQRFPDAPSRNRHQTLQHYSKEEREKEERSSDKTLD